ncbi:MAG TPA: hypothetical protein VKB56_04670 [Terriglobales bacterium]|nr:hypothetical protein [Terriglobales bacterium]
MTAQRENQPTKPALPTPESLARRRRRKPWVSLVLLVVVLLIWYRYWLPPVTSWLWRAVHGNSVGWNGRSIAVPKGWYARWPNHQPELRHLAVPLAHDATVTVLALPAPGGASAYDNFRAHAPDIARESGFTLQSIRTLLHGENRAFCLQGYNSAGMNSQCAFSNADFGLLFRGSPAAAPDFDTIVRSVLQ